MDSSSLSQAIEEVDENSNMADFSSTLEVSREDSVLELPAYQSTPNSKNSKFNPELEDVGGMKRKAPLAPSSDGDTDSAGEHPRKRAANLTEDVTEQEGLQQAQSNTV